jgi:hypothetical protein
MGSAEPADPTEPVPFEHFEVGHEATPGRRELVRSLSGEYAAWIRRRRSVSIGKVSLPVFVF